MKRMNKIVSILCASALTISLVGCGDSTKNEKDKDSSANGKSGTTATVQATEKPSLLPTGTYEMNLPDDIVLEYNGQSVSVVNTTGMALVEKLSIEPTKIYCMADPDDYDKYTNGLPQDYAFKIADDITEDNYMKFADKYYNDDYTDIRLQSVNIGEQNREEIPEVKLFGFGKSTTYEDVYKVLGTPDSIGGDEKGYDLCELQYREIAFGDTTINIYVVFEEEQYEGMHLRFNY